MKRKSKKTVVFGGLLMAILVILDQVTKFLAASMLKGHSAVELIPGVFELRYLENQSAAFGVDIVSILQKVFHFSYFEEHPEAFLSCKMALFAVFTIIAAIPCGFVSLRTSAHAGVAIPIVIPKSRRAGS